MTLATYRAKLRERSLAAIIRDRLRWYRHCFETNNWLIGRAIELAGNTVNMHGLTISVDNPLILTKYKSTLFFERYETDEITGAKQYIDVTTPLVELGGSIGVVACVTNRMLVDPSQHVVVEASPVLVPTLTGNRDRNGCKFTIEHAALAYGSDTVNFSADGDFLWNRVSDKGTIPVRTVTLEKLINKNRFDTINLICDIEGGELALVESEPEILRDRVKVIVMETHPEHSSESRVAAMLTTLESLGFRRIETGGGNVVVFVNDRLVST